MAFFPARAQPLVRKTLVVTGASTGDRPAGFEFDTGGMRPVDRVRVVFEEGNAVAEAAVFSRPGLDGEWRKRFTGWFYSLERIGTLVRNEPVRVEETTESLLASRARQWAAVDSAAAEPRDWVDSEIC